MWRMWSCHDSLTGQLVTNDALVAEGINYLSGEQFYTFAVTRALGGTESLLTKPFTKCWREVK